MGELTQDHKDYLEHLQSSALELCPHLEYDHKSITWLDGYLNHIHREFGEETKDHLRKVFAAFLGEAIVRNFGATWCRHDGTIAVRLTSGAYCYPFDKAGKQIQFGPSESILSFYEVCETL